MLIYGDKRKTLYGGEPETTNNRMELKAAIEALNALNGEREVRLHTDSKYVMDGINTWLPGWKYGILWTLMPILIGALAALSIAMHDTPLPGSQPRFTSTTLP